MEKKERKVRKGEDPESKDSSWRPGVILLDFHPPPEESSGEEDTENVIRKLQYEGLSDPSDTDKRSPSKPGKQSQTQEPQTPEELKSTNDPYIAGALVEVDAPERVEEQPPPAAEEATTAEGSTEPPKDGDKPERDGEDDPDKAK